MKKIRILITDDHSLMREGIRAMLEKHSGIEIVAEASNGLQAIQMVDKYKPDVILMDIGMKGLNGLDATANIIKQFPESKVIILSMHVNEEYVIRALRAGASGYLIKDTKMEELLKAVKCVASGGTYLSPQVSRHVIDNYVRSVGADSSPLEDLTPRQREILKLIAEGCSNRDIARVLNISIKTVDTHRVALMQRLDIHEVTGLVRFAIKNGLISLGN